MKLQYLLLQRETLLREAHLANLAYAHERLGEFGARIARARLHGDAALQPADADAGRPWPVLIADAVNPAVIEEHFTEEYLAGLADVFRFLAEDETADVTFRFEDVAARLQAGLRQQLVSQGVEVDDTAPAALDTTHDSR
ncbi:MAG: hypothetical protein ACHQ4G_09175 [Opitutales bacterium]